MAAQSGCIDEAIFKLIPGPEPLVYKRPRYVSKMGWKTPPTASTFGTACTAQLNVTNLNGSLEPPSQTHIYRKQAALFGPGHRTDVNPRQYLRKPNRALSAPISRPGHSKSRRCNQPRKEPIPGHQAAPIQGLVSNKNFIKTNVIEMILSEPIRSERRLPKDYPGYHSSYGKIPEYLHDVKRELALEYQYLESLRSRGKVGYHKEEKLAPLDESERLTLLKQLKSKWENIQIQYQGITHHVILDTIGQVQKKEKYERDLARLEADIKTLSKTNLLIRTS